MFCKYCGYKFSDDDIYCRACGKLIQHHIIKSNTPGDGYSPIIWVLILVLNVYGVMNVISQNLLSFHLVFVIVFGYFAIATFFEYCIFCSIKLIYDFITTGKLSNP